MTKRSGEYTLPYVRIRTVLLRRLSPVLVDSVLQRAMDARKLTPATLKGDNLAELTSDVMVGLRLFVPARELTELMLDLAVILESEDDT